MLHIHLYRIVRTALEIASIKRKIIYVVEEDD